ncbi:MAG: hypothetical protein DYG98_16775 [Haliscomenobacteraceae bacterium CHB4]|nr:hypothetical protein [Saprospiraceae bacterium]MCE7924704.1 hypothetical protein [Haliscomenobacteraceae bacterium CHB4]
MPSTFFDDFATALKDYTTDHVTIEIVDYELLPSFGAVLNKDDLFRFKVRVTNNSYLIMENIILEMAGMDAGAGSTYAEVAIAESGPYVKQMLHPDKSSGFSGFTLNAKGLKGSGHTTDWFYGKATTATGSGISKDILEVGIRYWGANLEHLLKHSTGGGAAKDVLNKEIVPI